MISLENEITTLLARYETRAKSELHQELWNGVPDETLLEALKIAVESLDGLYGPCSETSCRCYPDYSCQRITDILEGIKTVLLKGLK